LGLGLYAIFLVASPFEHHDLVCHLKNPWHCTSCSASQLGSDPQTLAVAGTSRLVDAGRAATFHLIVTGTLLPARSTGRSPPSHA